MNQKGAQQGRLFYEFGGAQCREEFSSSRPGGCKSRYLHRLAPSIRADRPTPFHRSMDDFQTTRAARRSKPWSRVPMRRIESHLARRDNP